MTRYVFHSVNESGEVVNTFHAVLAPAQLQRILHPYQIVLRAAVKLAAQIDGTPPEHLTPDVRAQTDAFWALLGEYTADEADE